MKVLYLNTRYHGGGAEKIARQLFFGMPEYGIETHMVVGYGMGNEDCAAINSARVSEVVQTVKGCLANNQPVRCIKSRRYLERYIKENEIDILHIHNAHGNYIGIEDISYLSQKCKIIWTLHDMWSVTGHCAHAFECEKWKTAHCYECEKKRSYPAFYYNDLNKKYELKQNAFTGKRIIYVTPSNWLNDVCRQSYLKNEEIITIHNGLPLGQYEPLNQKVLKKKYGVEEGRKVILFAAADVNNEYKGFSYMLQALAHLKCKKQFTIVVIGNGLDTNLVSDEFQVLALGYIREQKKMNEAYSLADVFALPSMADTFPGVALESMASGTPVVGFETGGIPEIVDDSTGWLVPCRDARELSKAIETAVSDDSLLKQKSNQGVQRINQQFSENRMLNQYKELYTNVIHQ